MDEEMINRDKKLKLSSYSELKNKIIKQTKQERSGIKTLLMQYYMISTGPTKQK